MTSGKFSALIVGGCKMGKGEICVWLRLRSRRVSDESGSTAKKHDVEMPWGKTTT